MYNTTHEVVKGRRSPRDAERELSGSRRHETPERGKTAVYVPMAYSRFCQPFASEDELDSLVIDGLREDSWLCDGEGMVMMKDTCAFSLVGVLSTCVGGDDEEDGLRKVGCKKRGRFD